MWQPRITASLTTVQRNMIIAHIDRPQPVIAGLNTKTRAFLIENRILTGDFPPGYCATNASMKRTKLTDFGREVLASILANYAEALVRTGYLEASNEPLTGRHYCLRTHKEFADDQPLAPALEPAE
jgi:hypothetical protein